MSQSWIYALSASCLCAIGAVSFFGIITLDEAGAIWVINSGFAEVSAKTATTLKLPFYYSVLWVWQKIGFENIYYFRLFSVLSLVLAGVYTLKIEKLLFPKQNYFSILFLALNVTLLTHGVFVRPYAFGLFLTCFAFYHYFNFTFNNKTRSFYYSLAVFSIIPYLNLYFLPVYGLGITFILFDFFSKKINLTKSHFLLMIASSLAQVPLFFERNKLAHFAHEDLVYFTASLPLVLETLLPITLLFPLILIYLCLYLEKKTGLITKLLFKREMTYLLLWYFLPLVFFLFYSLYVGQWLLIDKYLVYQIPTAAIFISILFKLLRKKSQFIVLFLTIPLVLITVNHKLENLTFSAPELTKQIAVLKNDNPECKFAVPSLYYESTIAELFSNEQHRGFFSAYSDYYIEAEHYTLPRRMTKKNHFLFAKFVKEISLKEQCVLLLSFPYNEELEFDLEPLLEANNLSFTQINNLGLSVRKINVN